MIAAPKGKGGVFLRPFSVYCDGKAGVPCKVRGLLKTGLTSA